jgi:2'-phosphotransferase
LEGFTFYFSILPYARSFNRAAPAFHHGCLEPESNTRQMNNQRIRSVRPTLDEIKQIVAENDKQRFSLIHKSAAAASANSVPAGDAATSTTSDIPSQFLESNDPADYLIRANQGHSLEVASENLLTPITEETMPSMVVHGTTHAAWPQIVATGGLKKMARTHVHFASGLPAGFKSEDTDTTAPVISGMRNSSSVLVYVNIKKAVEAGVKFWKSENGVILSEGDENGLIGLQYFSKVEDRTGRQGVLVEDGKVVKEAPESWTKPKKANKPRKQPEVEEKDHADQKQTTT